MSGVLRKHGHEAWNGLKGWAYLHGMSEDTHENRLPPDNHDPVTDDPVMDEDHLDEALEESFPASDPLPVPDRT